MLARPRAALVVAAAIAGGTVAGGGCGLELSGSGVAADGGIVRDATAADAADATLDGGALPDSGVSDASTDGDARACSTGPCATSITLGFNHSCALLAGGGVKCWGDNVFGELGFGAVVDGGIVPDMSSLPGAVAALAPALQISGGGLPTANTLQANAPFTCARVGVASLECWGSDAYAALGRGADSGSPDNVPHPAPLAVQQGDVVTDLSAGGAHACALLDGGAVACWGFASYGELARTPATGADPMPARTDTPLPRPATALALGGLHSCALLDDGSVACWGLNNILQLGRPTTLTIDKAPARAIGVADAGSISAGYVNTCATLAGGAVSCWGYDSVGQLGRGIVSTSELPGPVALPPGVRATQSCVGAYHACARADDGAVWCWGYNGNGQLGYGTVDTNGVVSPGASATPMRVAPLPSVRRIACGGFHTCALLDDGAVACWGGNAYGQLGRGADGGADIAPHPAPARVAF